MQNQEDSILPAAPSTVVSVTPAVTHEERHVIKVIRDQDLFQWVLTIGPVQHLRWPLRLVRKGLWTAVAEKHGSVPRIGKRSKAAEDGLDKREYSKPQSCSIVAQNITANKFGGDDPFRTIGFIANLDALPRCTRLWTHDVGSAVRPYDHHEAWMPRHRQYDTVDDMLNNMRRWRRGRSRYNEGFFRIKWGSRYRVAIFLDEDQAGIDSKLKAQWFAHLIAYYHNVDVPDIVFVLLNTEANTYEITPYDADVQMKDLESDDSHPYAIATQLWRSNDDDAKVQDGIESLVAYINGPDALAEEADMFVMQLACCKPGVDRVVDLDDIKGNVFTPNRWHDSTGHGLTMHNHAIHWLMLLTQRRLVASITTIARLRPYLIADLIRSAFSDELYLMVRYILSVHMSENNVIALVGQAFTMASAEPKFMRSGEDLHYGCAAVVMFAHDNQHLKNHLLEFGVFDRFSWDRSMMLWHMQASGVALRGSKAERQVFIMLFTICLVALSVALLEHFSKHYRSLGWSVSLCCSAFNRTQYHNASHNDTGTCTTPGFLMAACTQMLNHMYGHDDDAGMVSAFMTCYGQQGKHELASCTEKNSDWHYVVLFSSASLMMFFLLLYLSCVRPVFSIKKQHVRIILEALANPELHVALGIQLAFQVIVGKEKMMHELSDALLDMIQGADDIERACGHITDTLSLGSSEDLALYSQMLEEKNTKPDPSFRDDVELLELGGEVTEPRSPMQQLKDCVDQAIVLARQNSAAEDLLSDDEMSDYASSDADSDVALLSF